MPHFMIFWWIISYTTNITCETHSAVKRPNVILCKRMRSATDESKIINGCMQKHKGEKMAAIFFTVSIFRVRVGETERV